MEYTVAAGLALELALLAAVATGAALKRSFWAGLASFTVLTTAADSLLVKLGVFAYAGHFRSGLAAGWAPVEDLLYGAALYSVAVAIYRGRLGDRTRELLKAARPYSWPNTVLPMLACGLAAGRPTLALGLGALYFLAPYNLLLYGVNDVFDYESDRRNPRKGGAIEGAVVAPGARRDLAVAVGATNVPVLAVLALVAGAGTAVVLAATVLVALAYSAPPLRTKEIPGLDSLTSSLHFVLPAVAGGLLAGSPPGALPWRYLGAFLLWGAASQALGAIQDVTADRSAGIGSIAVSLGARTTAGLSVVLYLAAAVLVASGGGLAVAAAVALLPYPLLSASVLFGDAERQARLAWRGFLGMNMLSGFLVTQVLLRAWGVGRLTGAELLAWGSAAGAGALLAVFAANQLRMRRSGRKAPATGVTVVVPARDEAARIRECLAALPAAAEVLVVDDGSKDATAAVAREAGARVISAGPRPAGWTGKCWAAWTGAREAHRETVVFLDADTVLAPGALETVAGEASNGGLTSFVTRFGMSTRGERAVVPVFAVLQLAVFPHVAAPLANGPLMAVRRNEYLELGGHAAIAGSEREDLDLARLYRDRGRTVRLLRGADLATTRHYLGAREAVAAWRRMFYAYSGRSLAVALAGMAGLATVLLGPPLTLIAAGLLGDRPALVGALAGCAFLLALRAALAHVERQPPSTIAWHPVGVLAALAGMAASVADGLVDRRPVWRGSRLPEPMP